MVNSVNTAQTDVVVSWVNDELPVGFLPYDEFVQKFSLGNTSTEQVHERTKHLSQMMQADPVKGLELLLHADNAVLSGFELFTSQIATLAPKLAEKMKAGGRIFLVGSGSSGRMGIDIAAKCNKSALIQGVIAGGDSAMIRAKEGFEDSEADGATAMEALKLTSKDTVFLISSSGSASFNVGCGHFAANLGAEVFYFYNSKEIPERTQKLFSRTNNPVHPLELDIGAQAITGSTRLQGASLAEMCLGGLLGTAILHLEGKKEAEQYPLELFLKVREGNRQIRNNLEKIANFVQKEADVFLSPSANFRLLYDLKPQGYVTLLGDKSCLREILIDATETSPTFSMNPIRREKEVASKREEFRAYLIDEKENRAAWKALLGREVNAADLADIDQFLLSSKSSGQHALTSRPTGAGNFVIGVAKVRSPSDAKDLSALLSQMKGETGMILLSREKGKLPSNIPPLTLHLEGVPFDRFGIVETLLLKQTLNLISN
ncbi:MAG: hypothetical protein FJZ64_04165, partial [Chlamydiae bacterium]|nr:hypothetical protein [Chlamydiota bacterium]